MRHLKSILEHEAVDLKSVKLTEWQQGSVTAAILFLSFIIFFFVKYTDPTSSTVAVVKK